MKKLKKHKKKIIQCGLIFLALFFIIRFARVKYFDGAMISYTARGVVKDDGEIQQLRDKDGKWTQEFEVTTDVLWGVGLTFEHVLDEPQGEIKLRVTDTDGVLLYNATTAISDLNDNAISWFVFDEILENSQGKNLILELGTSERIKFNDKILQIYAQNAYLYKVFWGFAVVISLFIYGVYFALYIKKWKIEVIFLLFMIFTGMMYAVLVKPGAVPDEAAHYRTAYAYSNVLMGRSKEAYAEVWMDESDYEFYQETWYVEPNLSMHRDFQTDFLRREARGEMVTTNRWPIKAPAYLYAGQIAGITIGRAFGFNGLTAFYLGRFLNVLVFAGLAFGAMKKLPFYKMSLFVICLLPMSAHLVGSFSYDGMILAMSLVLVAHIMKLAFGQQTKHRLRDLIIVAVIGVLLGGCKGGAYTPLLALLCLLPMRCFKGKKQRLIFGGGIALGAIIMFIAASSSSVDSSVGSTVGWAQAPPYSIGWIFENPLAFIQLLTNTIASKGGEILNSLIGADLGWFNIPISTALAVSFLGIFVLSCIYVSESQTGVLLVPKQKLVIGIALILSVAMVVAGMMFSWTPIGSPAIEGIQGRYFIPLLLPLVFCLKNTTLTLKKSLDREMIFILSWLHIMTFINVLGVTFVASR